MAILPVVRYLIPCRRWYIDPQNPRRANIEGLLSNLGVKEGDPDTRYYDIGVFFALTEGFGTGQCHVTCTNVDREQVVFATPTRPLHFSKERLDVLAGGFHIKNCPFPWSGLYLIQLWYDSELLHESPLRVRER